MHMGRTQGPDRKNPMLRLGGSDDGAVSADGLVRGCYLHGLFAADAFRHAFLDRLKRRDHSIVAYEQEVEATLNALAGHLESHLDVDALSEIARARA